MRLASLVLVPLALAAAAAAHGWDPPGAEHMPRAEASLLIDIARAGSRLVAVGERGHILHSDDDGAHWMQADVPVRALLTAVFFADARHGWAVGHDGMIVASSDGGSGWTLQRDGLVAQRELDRRAVERARARVAELAASAHEEDEAAGARLDQAGIDLEEAEATLAAPVAPPPLFDILCTDLALCIAVGAFGTVLATTDGGASWSDASGRIDNPERAHLYAITALDGGELLVAGEGGRVYHSSDGGLGWDARATGHSGTLFGLAALPGTRSVYAAGTRGSVLYSADGGSSWVGLASRTHAVLGAVVPARAGGAWIVGSAGTLLRAIDNRVETCAGSARRSDLAGLLETRAGALIAVGQGGIEPLDPATGRH